MMPNWLVVVTLLAALGCGVMAGVFFAFSAAIMNALGRLPPNQGIAAMQSINVAVINPWFLGAFLGTAGICLILTVSSLFMWQTSGNILVLIGSLIYLIGAFAVTIALNIPRNDALAVVDSTTADGAQLWAIYLTSWTAWNHVRMTAALAAAATLTLALC